MKDRNRKDDERNKEEEEGKRIRKKEENWEKIMEYIERKQK